MYFPLSTFRAHFCVITCTKNGLRMCIISARFNDFECMLLQVDKNIKIIKSLSCLHETKATAYLDMVNVFRSHDFFYCIDQRGRLSISLWLRNVLCGTMPCSVPRWVPKESEDDSIVCRTSCSLNGVSFVLCFFKFHFLQFAELPN